MPVFRRRDIRRRVLRDYGLEYPRQAPPEVVDSDVESVSDNSVDTDDDDDDDSISDISDDAETSTTPPPPDATETPSPTLPSVPEVTEPVTVSPPGVPAIITATQIRTTRLPGGPAGPVVSESDSSSENPAGGNTDATKTTSSSSSSLTESSTPIVTQPTSLLSSTTRAGTADYPVPTTAGLTNGDLGSGGNIGAEASGDGGGGLRPGVKAGIAIGSIAGAALLAGLLFLLYRWCRGRRNGSRAEDPPPLPNAQPASTTQRAPDTRTDSQILEELMAAAHAHQNGGMPSSNSNSSKGTVNSLIPAGYVVTDEKGNRQTLDLEALPTTGPQPVIRASIASWLRRHHPLKLNPMALGLGPRSPRSMRSMGSPSTLSSPRFPSNRGSFASPAQTAAAVAVDESRLMAGGEKARPSSPSPSYSSPMRSPASDTTFKAGDSRRGPGIERAVDGGSDDGQRSMVSVVMPLPRDHRDHHGSASHPGGAAVDDSHSRGNAAKFNSVWSSSTRQTMTSMGAATVTSESGHTDLVSLYGGGNESRGGDWRESGYTRSEYSAGGPDGGVAPWEAPQGHNRSSSSVLGMADPGLVVR